MEASVDDRFEPEFFETLQQFRRKHRLPRFCLSIYAKVLLVGGIPLLFYLLVTGKIPRGALSNLAIGALAVMVLWVLGDFIYHRIKALNTHLARRYIKSLARRERKVPPRAVLDGLTRQGRRKAKIRHLRSAWRCGALFPRKRWFPEHPCPVSIREKLLLDFDGFLNKLDSALEFIYGDRIPAEAVDPVVPAIIEFNDKEYPELRSGFPGNDPSDMSFVWLYAVTRSRQALEHDRTAIVLDLEGFDRWRYVDVPEIFQRACETALEKTGITSHQLWDSLPFSPERKRFIAALKRATEEEVKEETPEDPPTPCLYFVVDGERIEFPAEFTLAMVIAAVAGLLYTFYECPWDWKPRVIEKDFRLSDGSLHTLRLSFDPEKELRLERIGKPSPAGAEN